MNPNKYPGFWPVALLLATLTGLVSSCVINSFSERQKFYDLLHKDPVRLHNSDTAHAAELKRVSDRYRITLTEYRQFNDRSAHDSLYKFHAGCYLLRIENTEIQVPVNRRGDRPSRETIPATVSRSSDTLLPPFSDKLVYLVFLDDHRVIYHSPYRKNYLKTGTFGKVTTRRESTSCKPRYAHTTENFIKLGPRYEYNSVHRGYYKLDGNELLMCLELNSQRKKCAYPTELMLLKFKTLPSVTAPKIRSLIFDYAWYEDRRIRIDSVFQAFEQPDTATRKLAPVVQQTVYQQKNWTRAVAQAVENDTSRLRFSYLNTPFTLLLVDQDSATRKTNFHLVDRIETLRDGRRKYECKLRHQVQGSPRNAPPVIEKLDAIITF